MTQQPLDYESPGTNRTPTSIRHAVLGTLAALAAGPGLTFAAILLTSALGGGGYAGLTGLVFGGGVGVVLTLAALVVGIRASRSSNGRRRGFGIGLLLGGGLSLLAAGACFIAVN